MFGVSRRPVGDPWVDLLYNLERRMGRVVADPFADLEGRAGEATSAWVPVMDIVERPEALHIVAEIPGVAPDDVKIAVEGNVLTIRGTKEQMAAQNLEKVHRYERMYGTFERSFTLPGSVDVAAITAMHEHGLLTVVLPKVAKAKPREIAIDGPAKLLKD
jgi:HSP20 family protein